MKNNLVPSGIVIILLFLFSCEKPLVQVDPGNLTIETLKEFSSDPYIIDYRIARKLALFEIENNFKDQLRLSAKVVLSEIPLIIYDYDCRPKYYEFTVSNEVGEPLATVATLAKKEAPGVVSHVLPWTREPHILEEGYQLFKGKYPTNLYKGIKGSPGSKPLVLRDEKGSSVAIPNGDPYHQLISIVERMADEDLATLKLKDKADIIRKMSLIMERKAVNAKMFWDIVDRQYDEILRTRDSEICDFQKTRTMFSNDDNYRIFRNLNFGYIRKKRSLSHNDTYVIPYDEALKHTRWSGWCGPSALAWVYRSLYNQYKGYYLPLVDEEAFYNRTGRWIRNGRGQYYFDSKKDTNKDGKIDNLDRKWVFSQSRAIDGGLYADIAGACDIYFWYDLTGDPVGPTLPWHLKKALEKVTQNTYSVVAVDAHDHIRINRLPVIWWTDWFQHYMVAFGSKYTTWDWTAYNRTFGDSQSANSINAVTKMVKWLFVTDNGYEISKKGYSPYWKKDSFDFSIKFGVYKKATPVVLSALLD